jgi:IS30 family transposase
MKKTSGFKHSLYADFLLLYKCIYYQYTNKKTCQLLGKDRSTVFRILHKYVKVIKGTAYKSDGRHRYCLYLRNCIRKEGFTSCPHDCPKFKQYQCSKLLSWPYVCNGCENDSTCRKEKHFFDLEYALGMIRNNESESKHAPKVDKKKLEAFDYFISPLIKAGISIEAIYEKYPGEFPASIRTVRNWINEGYLTAKRSDLINTLSRPYISKAYKYAPVTTRNPLMKASRTFEDYLKFKSEHPGFNVVQLDTVHGKKGDKKCILTIYDVASKLQLGILLENFTAIEVKEKVNDIRSMIGDDAYSKMFRIMLADNGPEFDEIYNLEIDDETGEKWINVFFTRPYRSGDKGACERNHELFRYILVKGKTMNNLTQDDLNYYFSMINSYPRKSLNGKCPIEVVDEIYGKDFHQKINLKKLSLKEINFRIRRK